MICIDCGVDKVATIQQCARTPQGVNHWHICYACLDAFGVRKDAAAREWREKEQALKDALRRTPFGQVTPESMRGARSTQPAAKTKQAVEIAQGGLAIGGGE